MLLHRFEQRALHLGGGAVDFVRQHEVGEDRALARVESAVLRAVDQRADDVGGQQIGGELNALEVGIGRGGERADAQGLGEPRHAFEQHVAVGEQANK